MLRVVIRTRAWRNIIAAAYPETRVRRRSVTGAYLAGVGEDAITPAFRAMTCSSWRTSSTPRRPKHLPHARRDPRREALFDAVIGLALLISTIHLGVLPSLDALDQIPSIDWGWLLRHPQFAEAGALVLGIGVGAVLVIATRRVRAFWHRVALGFAIVRRPRAYFRHVVTWQALSWVFRLAGVYWMLRAFHVPASVHNALLVQVAQSMSTVLPITPGGAGTEQGLLLYLFSGTVGRTALLSFSVGMHIAIVVINVVLGLVALAVMTKSLRFRGARREASGDPERSKVGNGIPGPPPL